MRSRNRSAGETVEFFFSRNRVATLGLGDAFIEFRDLFRRKASETSALFRSFRKLLDQFAPLGRRECLEQFEDALSGFDHGLENSTKRASCEASELLVLLMLLVDSNSAALHVYKEMERAWSVRALPENWEASREARMGEAPTLFSGLQCTVTVTPRLVLTDGCPACRAPVYCAAYAASSRSGESPSGIQALLSDQVFRP
jgi:hypothetical protein